MGGASQAFRRWMTAGSKSVTGRIRTFGVQVEPRLTLNRETVWSMAQCAGIDLGNELR